MKKADLIAKCKDLGIDTSGLDTNAKLKAAIDAKEAETAAEETSKPSEGPEEENPEATPVASEATSEEETEEETVDSWEDETGIKWGFKPTAPKRLNIDGRSYSREEILSSEEIISELVYGKNPHITRLYK